MKIIKEDTGIGTMNSLKENLIYRRANITEFEAYFENTDPYYDVDEDGDKKYYKLIIRDDDGNEFWLDANCGYPGGGPSRTENVLQLLGIREDFRITKRRVIKETNLKIDLSLNILVSTDLQLDDKKSFLFMACANFSYPFQRLNTINLLKNFGYLSRFFKIDFRVVDYFNGYKEDNSFGEYGINNTYVVNETIKEAFNSKDIKTIISAIIINNEGTVEFNAV